MMMVLSHRVSMSDDVFLTYCTLIVPLHVYISYKVECPISSDIGLIVDNINRFILSIMT